MSENTTNIPAEENLSELLQIRRDKLKQLQDDGKNPFDIVKYDVTDYTEDIKANFENYIDGDDDIYGYITQAVETDSIKYAMVAVVDYFSAIEDYLEEGNE